MDKKKNLSAEERMLFADAVKNVKPFDESNKTVFIPAVKPVKRKISSQVPHISKIAEFSPVDLEALAPEQWIGIEDKLVFNRSGLQDKLLKKLAHGQLPLEARLDLHRLTVATALAQAEFFLQHCQQQGLRVVLIIHGKGKKSAKPILKNAVNIWLRTQDNVLAFHSAQPKDGGAGAVYVLLKKI